MAGLDATFLLVFVAVLGAVMVGIAIWMVVSPDGNSDAKLSRLRKMKEGGEATGGRLRKRVPRSWMEHVPYLAAVPRRMRQAGMGLAPHVLLMIAALVTAILFVALQGFAGAGTAFAIALAVGFILPGAVISAASRKRTEALTRQLPEALDQMKRGLSVGHPLGVTIRNVAADMSEPLAGEFRALADQVAYGDSLTDAMLDMADRLDTEDFHYLAAAVEIQHATGGNLGAMLDTLSRVIRARFAMRRRVTAVSSEGRITAIILTLMPFVMYLGTSLTAPGYYSAVQDDPLFWPMCVAIALLVVGNGLMLKKLVTFRV